MNTTPPIPIIYILEEMNFGGTQRQTLELARHLNKDLFSPKIWTVRAGDELLNMAKSYGIEVEILRNDASLRPFSAAYTLYKTLRLQKPHLIHLGTVFPNVWGRILGTLLKIPIIIGGCKGQGNVRLQHENRLKHLAHAHICDALSIKTALEELGAKQVHCIFNGVDVEFFTPLKQRVYEPQILCVGRMVREKDHATLLQAFSLVLAKIPTAQLHLVGDGPLLSELKTLAAKLSIQEAVIFHGSSTKVLEHMHKARVLVLSSTSEGTPNVLLEAMACALPVVATAVAGIPDMIKHGKQGLLVPPSNAKDLAYALELVLQDDALAQDLGDRGREHVCKNYSLKTMAQKHEDVYLNLCHQKGLCNYLA